MLANLCAREEKRFLNFINELKILDAYYIESRYPPTVSVYSKREAKKALETAEEIIRFIKGLLRKRK